MIPPGRSDHEPCRSTGKAYGGPVSLVTAVEALMHLLRLAKKPLLHAGRLSPRTKGLQQPFKGIGRQLAQAACMFKDHS